MNQAMVKQNSAFSGRTAAAVLLGLLLSAAALPGPTSGPRGPQVVFPLGHGVTVAALAFSPDGRTLAAAVNFWRGGSLRRGDVELWDLPAGRLRQTLRGRQGAVLALAFSPDGSRLAAGSDYPSWSVTLWDLPAGQVRWVRRPGRSDIRSVAFSPDGRTVAGAGKGGVNLYDVQTGETRRTLPCGGDLVSAAFLPDGGLAVGSSADDITGWIDLWSLPSGQWQRAWQWESGTLCGLTVSPDGRTVASTGSGRIALHPLPSGTRPRILDRRRLLPRAEQANDGVSVEVRGMAFSPDGHTLAGGVKRVIPGWGPNIIGEVDLWDVDTGRLRRVLTGHSDYVWSVAFSRDGRLLASGSDEGAVKLWDAATGKERASLLIVAPATTDQEPAGWIAFTPDGFYDGSPGIERTMTCRAGGRALPAARCAALFRRPGRVEQALR